MDKAVIGYMRIGHFRIGVFRPDWDQLLQTFENINTPHKMVMDGKTAKMDEGPKLRMDVAIPVFEELLKTFKEA